MFRDEYAKWVERAPLPPGFAERLARVAVEKRRAAQAARPRRAALALAAILLALLLAGAALAAAKLGMLGKIFEERGADEEAAARVQELGVEGGGEILRAAFGDAIWEGNDLYVSFTASVPDDGNTYLLALMPPARGGKMVDFATGMYLYYDIPIAFALGGDGPTELSQLMHLVPGDADGSKPFELAMDVVLLRAYKEVVGIPHMEFYAQMTEEASSAIGDESSSEVVQPEADDRLYYAKSDEDTDRSIDMRHRRDVFDYIERKKAEFREENPPRLKPVDPSLYFGPEYEEVRYDDFLIGAEMLEELGIGEKVDAAELKATVYPSAGARKVAEQRAIEGNGFTAKIASFEMTHLGIQYAVEIYPDGGAFAAFEELVPAQVDKLPPFAADMSWWGSIGECLGEDGARGTEYEYDFRGILPTIPEKIRLVPVRCAGEGRPPEYLTEYALELTLVDG